MVDKVVALPAWFSFADGCWVCNRPGWCRGGSGQCPKAPAADGTLTVPAANATSTATIQRTSVRLLPLSILNRQDLDRRS
jgi:hypothetical protein